VDAVALTLFAFYGTFTSGQPGHGNLGGARLVERTRTAPRYRLFLVDGRWPALLEDERGHSIECELYECSEELLARLAQVEPPGWDRAPVELADGRRVEAFLGDAELFPRGVDVSAHGSWAAFVSSERQRRARGPTPR
jgi:allophanate hydrolase